MVFMETYIHQPPHSNSSNVAPKHAYNAAPQRATLIRVNHRLT